MEHKTHIIEQWFDDPTNLPSESTFTGRFQFVPQMWGTTDFYDRALELGITDTHKIATVMAMIDWATEHSRTYDIDFDTMVNTIFELYFVQQTLPNSRTQAVLKYIRSNSSMLTSYEARAIWRMQVKLFAIKIVNPTLAFLTRQINKLDRLIH